MLLLSTRRQLISMCRIAAWHTAHKLTCVLARGGRIVEFTSLIDEAAERAMDAAEVEEVQYGELN